MALVAYMGNMSSLQHQSYVPVKNSGIPTATTLLSDHLVMYFVYHIYMYIHIYNKAINSKVSMLFLCAFLYRIGKVR